MPSRIRVRRERIQSDALQSWRKGNPDIDNGVMQVGVFDPNIVYPDGTRLIDVATWNEFGTAKIPARPALRRSISRMAPKLAEIGARQALMMLHGKLRFDVAARRLAKMLVFDMQDSITSFRTPRNADSTIERKGFDDPLIETGFYRDSIGYKLLRTRKDGRASGSSQGQGKG